MSARLLVDIPQNWAYTFALHPGKSYTAGRVAANHIHVPALGAAPNHAEFYEREGQPGWNVRDLDSENGVWVNGKRVRESALRHGDIVRLGTCEMVYQNTSETAAQAEWKRTKGLVAEREFHLREALTKQDAETIRIEGLDSGAPKSAVAPAGFAVSSIGTPDTAQFKAADLLWIGEQLADILKDVLDHPGGRDAVFAHMLQRLRGTISADNGFLMLPNEEKTRWIIRAWVGDHFGWSDYEKSHPVPLTVANKAWESKKLVSNALDYDMGDDEPLPQSMSMQVMQVHCYIAVPLLEAGKRHGVLYFDTRRSVKMFTPREVKLIERAGSYILEIEKQKAE